MGESSAAAGAAAPPLAVPASPQPELTSFNLLPPEGDAGEASFAPWQLLSRVRDALTGAATTQVPAAAATGADQAVAHAPDAERASRTQPASAGASSVSGGKSGTTAPPGSRMPSLSVAEPEAAAPRKASGVSASSALASGSSQRRTSSTLSKPAPGSSGAAVSLLRSSGESAYASTAATSRATARSVAPFALRLTRASALTSTAKAHAHAAKEAVEGDSDSLGALNSSRPSPWGAVPGFPLPRDLLADDARSIRSTSSRPRSELDFPSISMPNVASTSALGARASPAPSSAEAIRRLREGAPGGDRRFWLPDHHAAACGGCGMQFSTWRRRHHCRTCYLVFCASCASTMLPTRGANGLPGVPARTCDGCVKLLRDTAPNSVSGHRRARLDSTASSGPGAVEKTDISAPLEASTHSPQAQFGANALFARSRGLPSTLSMGGMAGFGHDWDDERSSRPATPDMAALRIDRRISEEEGVLATATAPFRRGLGDEDKAPATPDEDLEQFMQRASGEAAAQASSRAEPTSAVHPAAGDATAEGSSMSRAVPLLAFPTRSSDSAETPGGQGGDTSPNTRSRLTSDAAAGLSSDARSRLVSDAALRAFRRSRLRTRTTLDDVHGARDADDGSGSLGTSRRDSYFGTQSAGTSLEVVPSHGLGPVSLAYLRTLLAQCLVRARIPDTHNWAHVLLPLILTVCSKVRPRPRADEACDVRAYLKLKRIPGGEPSDSVYVPGVVLSKHVATKRMARNLPLVRPRVMLLAFAVDFGTQGLTSLDRAMHEKEYTRVLISRIVQLRPNLLVVRDNVSRLAIDMLEEAGVTVVWSVKQSALEAIARCCSADIIPSIDRLALEPRLGRCASLSVETYTHALLPSARKSLMRFLAPAPTREMPLEASAGLMSGGMQATTGGAAATIVLRGGSMAMLGRVKAVLDLCAYVAHNLRLEECLARDEGTQLLAPPPPPPDRKLSYAQTLESPAPDELCKAIECALRRYQRTLLNASAAVRLMPPYPLVKLRDCHENLVRLEAERAKAEVAQIRLDEEAAAAEAKESTPTPTRADPHVAQPQEPLDSLQAIDGDASSSREDPDETPRADDYDDPDRTPAAEETPETPTRSSHHAQSRPELPLRIGSTDSLPALDAVLPQPSVLARETEYRIAKLEDEDAQRAWEAQEQTSKKLTPFAHQRIVTLVSVMSSATQRPCEGPELRTVEYYGQGDETLGRYLERMCSESTIACVSKGCGRPRLSHFSVYVHNEARVLVVLERFVCPIPGQEGRMLMWSYCKRCEQASPVTPVSPDTLCLSFAKYLELHFSPEPPAKQTPCGHDFFRDHVRFFALQNLAVRFHTDAVEVRDVVLPHLRLLSRPDTDGRLKSEEASTLARRMAAYFDSVGTRIAALLEEASSCRDAALVAKSFALLEEMSTAAKNDAATLARALTRACQETEPTDVLGLSVVRRRLQEVVVRWDRDFDAFERGHLPSERDGRRLTTSGLSRMFAERDPSERTVAPSIASSLTAESNLSLPPAVEVDEQTASRAGSGAEPSSPRRSDAASSEAAEADRFAAQLTTSLQSAKLESSSSLDEVGSGLPSQLTSAAISTASTAPPTPLIDADPKDSDASPEDDRKPFMANSPAAWRRRRVQRLSKGDSSSTETENDTSMQQLVKRFESPEQGSSLSPTDNRSTPLRRPGLRRGKTEDAALPSQRRTAANMLPESNAVTSGLSDGESSAAPIRQAPRALRLGGRPRSPSKAVRGAAGLANSMPTSPRAVESPGASLGPVAPVSQGSRRPAARRGPPSAYRAPKHSETDSDFTGGRPRGGSSSSASASRGRIAAALGPDRSASATGEKHSKARGSSKGTLSRLPPTTTSTLRANPSGSRVPLPVRREPAAGSGTVTPSGGAGRSRVSTMARHFDRLNKEAERERERQQRVLAIRARRAQPVAATHARVEVFSNVLDAVKDDESDTSDDEPARGETEAGAVSGGEAEDEADSDAERGPLPRASRREASTATITPANFAKEATEAQRSGAVGRVEGLPIVTPTSETSSLFGDQSVPASALAKISAADKDVSLPAVTTPQSETASGSAMTVGGSFLVKTLSSLWGRGRALPLLDYPIASSEHFFADSGVVLREDEPSSLIAFTLSSSTYQHRLETLRASHASEPVVSADAGDCTFSSERWDTISVESRPPAFGLEAQLRRPEGTHLRFEFNSGGSRFHIRTLFTEQFDALRRACGCEQSFIQSLSRCVKWDSSGGKSGSAFLKTKDDRFVIKEFSRAEMEAFLSGATGYFQYMAGAIFGARPTTLAKIFGCFRISIRNTQTGKSIKLDCLVIENLFYGRQMHKIFDLKGSLRNRHIRETGRADEVLLDENLVEIASKSPLFVREHDKRLLRAALWNDSLWLERQNVMDYSLVVGLDKDRKELVVGSIDFVRTYTWDKKAESWLKEASGLGGSKATPTVITPGLYRQRFLSFLDSSFLLVPDAWFTPVDEALPLHGSTSSSALYAAGGIISGKDAPATS